MSDAGTRAARRRAADAFYGPLASASSGAARVGWESAAAHLLRMRAIVEALGDLTGLGTILDAGCGEAALWSELRHAGFAGHYRGEDVLPHMVEAAARGDAGRDDLAELVVADSLAGGCSAAGVVCSGLLNTATLAGREEAAQDARVQGAMTALWERTREVLVLDLAVRDRHRPGASLATADLSAAWHHARRLTPVVCVREDVAPGEALLVLRRDRAASLDRHLSGSCVVERARILLEAEEPEAALRTLAADRSAEGAAWRGLAALAAGRPRDAEAILGQASRTSARARLHLAVVFLATRRRARGLEELSGLAASEGVATDVADEARLVLARAAEAAGDEAGAAAWRTAIIDPFVRREA